MHTSKMYFLYAQNYSPLSFVVFGRNAQILKSTSSTHTAGSTPYQIELYSRSGKNQQHIYWMALSLAGMNKKKAFNRNF